MEYEDVAVFALDYFKQAYEKELSARYKLKDIADNGMQLLDTVARKRGCLRSGGIVDLHKAAEIVLHEFRSAKIGKLSLETPEMVIVEERQIEEARRIKAEEIAEKKRQAQKGKRPPQADTIESSPSK